MVSHSTKQSPAVAIMPLQGEYGEQAADMIAEQLAIHGLPTIERAQLSAILKEHNYRESDNFDRSTFSEYGKLLGVKKIFFGTITTIGGPLYSYRHVNMTLKVVDVATGEVTWIGRYGNSMWSSAISTQGDIQRGAKAIVKEFITVHGTKF
jgi:TolB-like protein